MTEKKAAVKCEKVVRSFEQKTVKHPVCSDKCIVVRRPRRDSYECEMNFASVAFVCYENIIFVDVIILHKRDRMWPTRCLTFLAPFASLMSKLRFFSS